MKLRTLVIVVLALVAVLATVSFWSTNQEVLGQSVRLWADQSVNVGVGFLLFFAAGIAVVFLLLGSRELGVILERYRLRREGKKSEEIEDEYSRGLVADLEGREEEALAHFRAVLERDSRHFNTLIQLGEVLRGQGKYAEAIEYHRKAQHIKEGNTRPLYALVDDYEAKGDVERARVVLGQIIGLNKNSVAAWRKLRSLHINASNWAKALEAHEKVRRLGGRKSDPADRRVGLGIRYEAAAALLDAGKARETAGAMRKLLKEEPQFIPGHAKLGDALSVLGQEAEAVQAWYQGFETTGSPTFLTILEDYYLSREQPLAAIEALKRCVSLARKDTLARFYLGKLYFRLEMLDDAMSVLSSLEGRATYAPTLHYLLGRIHERRNNTRGAASEYRKVIKEMDLVQLEYQCRSCRDTSMSWVARCPRCQHWNTIEVNFREEIPLEELGLAPAPIYTTGDR